MVVLASIENSIMACTQPDNTGRINRQYPYSISTSLVSKSKRFFSTSYRISAVTTKNILPLHSILYTRESFDMS